jgi:mono/diheme cytochrome c family protein
MNKETNFLEIKMMKKAKLLRSVMSLLLLTVAALALPKTAVAATPLFDTNCGSCHGNGNAGGGLALAVQNKTAAGTRAAINPGITLNNLNSAQFMSNLASLSAATLDAIAAEIGGSTPPPTPTPTPTPTPLACNSPNQVINGICTLPIPGTVGKASSGVARTDVYRAICAKGTKYLSLSVKDLLPVNPAKLGIQGTKGSSSSVLSIDKTDGDDSYSRLVKLAQGPGVYLVKVNKFKSKTIGAEAYEAQIVCRNAKGVPTDTKVKIRQNQ